MSSKFSFGTALLISLLGEVEFIVNHSLLLGGSAVETPSTEERKPPRGAMISDIVK
jgi:hypothetical protein